MGGREGSPPQRGDGAEGGGGERADGASAESGGGRRSSPDGRRRTRILRLGKSLLLLQKNFFFEFS